MKIFIGADHRGFELKEKIVSNLRSKGFEVVDLGTHEADTACDYPQISYEVATNVVKHQESRGILLCNTGIGHTICANKVPGIFAALVYNTDAAALSRQHNNSNVLVMGSKFTNESQMLSIIDVWLTTSFEGGRHQRRIDAIIEIEKQFSK